MCDQDSKTDECRICLERIVDVDWNERFGCADMTYKDCYYKYTHLDYVDDINFSSMLCQNCAKSLEFIDAFISKAIENHLMLQEKFRFNMVIKDDADIKTETNFETIMVEETEIKPDIQNLTLYEDPDEDFLTLPAETKSCSKSESITTPTIQTRKKRERKSTKRKKSEDLRTSNQITDGDLVLDDRKPSKKMVQSICCTICSKVLSSKYKAIKHEKTHIQNRERNETCVECGLKFFSKDTLKSHMQTHLENREKAHKCEFCDKAFFNKGGLNVHRRIHLGQMTSCSLCSKQFYRQIDLDKHMNSHSAVMINSTIKTKSRCFIRCKDCGKNIRTTSFKYHNAIHMNEPLYKCTICNKEFFHRSSCVKHLKRTHKRPNGDITNYMIAYKKNRISHLYIQQNANVQSSDK